MVYNFIQDKEDSEIVKVFNNVKALGHIKYNRRTYNEVVDRVTKLQKNIGASMNFNRDYQDDNYKYNKLRTKLIDQRKRKAAREATNGI